MSHPDRRAALKARHRAAILAAAAELMQETGGVAFTVDTLAERADVSRRTVFNHFASLDDVVTTVVSDVLGGLVDTFLAHADAAPTRDDSLAAMFDEVIRALRASDLVGPMATLLRPLGGGDESPLSARLLQRSFGEVGRRFSGAMAARHPGADPLDVDLLVSSLVGGLIAVHRHWSEATGARDTPASRRLWGELVDRLVANVRTGFGAGASEPAAP